MRIASAPDGSIHIDGKVVTALDRFVTSVTEIIERYTRYVIVSGYVAILFGRARGTEDIDLFIDYMDRDTFMSFSKDLLEQGFYFLNSDDIGEIYSMLCDRLAVRIAKTDRIIPNVEMKFKKDDFDHYAISRAKVVQFDDIRFFVSPIELADPLQTLSRERQGYRGCGLSLDVVPGDARWRSLAIVHGAPAGPGGALWN